MAASVPSKIGKYDVVGVIGRGGMGIVYKAIDPRLDREVAIKMMTGGFVDDPDLRKRFFREAQSLANLQHPNIVTVYDLGDYEGNPYLVMQYLEGETLDVAMAQHRKLSLLEKFNIIIQVCGGLAYSHKRFVVHRDIKPANIMLEKDGGTKIFDFGIAHVGDQSVTKTGQMVGTPPYMSPEQINGKTVDARSDLFSVGVVLYQMLTDHLPFQGDSPALTFLKILYDPIPALKTYLPSYPQELDAILERALAKNPNDRYHSADEFALDVGHLLSQFRQEVVGRQMREVGLLLERSELQKARDLLLQVLNVDPRHLPASQSLRDVERRIKKEEIGEQVRRLRQQADEALSQRQLEAAQAFLEHALEIDNTDPDLRQHAESVRATIAQARKLREALKAAESAHQDGDLDIAQQAIEEAVQIAPDDTQAKALYRVIQREWLERSRQRQIETYLFQARQHISARKFTDALERLKLAQGLDPGAPQIHSLMETATAGLEQERRRKEIEAAVREIESALNSDDYRGACQKAEEALTRFPEERTIIKLKALAERQRQIEERHQLVEEQLALARKLLQVNRNDELLASLEAAIAKIGPEPRLQSLLGIVTENVQRERLERRKSEALQQARELVRNQQYDSAIRTLESARAELKNEPEVDDLLQFVKEEAAAEKRRRETEAVAQKARAFVAEQKYDDAIRVLESALQQKTDPDLRVALAEIRRAAAEYHEKMETALVSAEKMLQARKFVEAVKLLESQPPAYFRNRSFSTLLESARSQAERMRRVREVIDQSQRLCDNRDYLGAHRLLDEWRRGNGTEPELDAHDALIEQRRIDAARSIAEKAISDVRELVSSREYQAGLDKLQSIAELVADLPEAMAKEYRSLRQVATTGLVDSRKSQIEDSVDKGELTRAGNILRQALVQFPGESNLSELGKVVEGEKTRRGAAKKKLEQAQAAFDEQQWHSGTELLAEAFASSNRAPAARAKVIDAFVQAAFLAVETDWRAAEHLLKRLASLKPDYDPPSLLRLQIREHEREEAVGRYLGHAKALIAMGKLHEALDKVSEGLKSHNDDVTLLEMRKSVLERIRQEEERARQERSRLEKEAFLRDVSSRVEREPSLERRIAIIEEALTRFPQEQQLQQQSSAMRDLVLRLTAISEDASKFEAGGKYDEALAQWNILRSLHPLQPELDSNIARVTRLREQVRAKAKAEWVEKIRRELAASDFERTQALLREAAQQFPRDQVLVLLEVQLGDAIKAREKAEKYLVEASRAFEKMRWAKGIEALVRALESAPTDAVVKNQSFNSIAKASEAALVTDHQTARLLLDRAAVLAPSSPVVSGLEQKIKERERELAIVDRLNRVRRVQQGGDLEAAGLELDLAIKSYPEEHRFIQAKIEIERQLQAIEERKAQEHERARQAELEREERKRQEAARLERVRAEEAERKRLEEEKWGRLRAEQLERERKEATERERIRAEEAERKRLEEEKQKRLRAEQLERERKEAAEHERLRAEEAERQRLEEEKQKRLRAKQLERERKEAGERERIRAEEAERKRLEEEKQKRLCAEQLERERKEAAEGERIRAEEAERKRLEKIEQEKALALQRERERQREQERLKGLEQERLQAEKRRREEQQRLQEEELRKQEQLRKERELAKQQERERKEQEKSRKRKERERKEAAAAEKRKQEQEAKHLREEERRKEALQQKEKKAAPIPVPPQENVEMSATRVLSAPEPAPKASAKAADQARQGSIPQAGLLASVNSGTRKVIFAGTAVLLVAVAVILWRLLVPHTIKIQVTSIPDGASVTITAPNQPTFKRECVTPRCGLDLDPGPYALEIRHEGFEPSTQTIQVGANGAHSFSVTLVATATPSGGGTSTTEKMADLQVRGLKDGSELYVDGKSAGRVGHKGEIAVQVQAGEHRVKVLAKNEKSIIVVRNFVAGQVVSLGRDEFFPHTVLAPEDVDWQKVLDSTPTVDSLEKFLQKYPSGTHRAEARDMLESSYWDKDSHANTAGSYREYLGHFPQGPHAGAAAEELAYLDAYSQKDPASLDAFVSRYPSSRHRAEIGGLRDDATWKRTDPADEDSLNAYLKAFPSGGHVGEAKGRLGEIHDDEAWQRTNRGDENSLNAYLKAFPGGKHAEGASDLVAKIHASANAGGAKPPRPSQKELDDAAIRVLLKGYESAFDTRNVDALLKIWPSMGTKEYRKLKDTFAALSSMSMQVEIRDIEFSGTGDTATVNTLMSQSARVSGGGGNQPPPHKDQAVFELTKTNGSWIIRNVR
ncbi:MAG TPA: protein kinase [Candidatus Sulfotelmatobacter sp.]|nr:protein kinase [Candidatus Sulfotelmatobacter sp.]